MMEDLNSHKTRAGKKRKASEMLQEDPENNVKEVQNEFSSPWPQSDIIFVVEGRQLHCNKAVLSMVSPVFEAMFEQDFKEKAACEVPLPEKKDDDMLEFFRWIHPHSNKDGTDEKLEVLLILADEYQCQMLTKKCQTFLAASLEKCLLHTTMKLSHSVVLSFAQNKAIPTAQSNVLSSVCSIPGKSVLRWLRLTDQFFPESSLLEGLIHELEQRMECDQLTEAPDFKRLSSVALRLLFQIYTGSLKGNIR